MNAEKLLDELTIYKGLPEAAIRAANEHRAEALPIFLGAIEAFVVEEDPDPEVPNPLFLIFLILGSWREKSAYRPAAKLLMCDAERIEWTLGDAALGPARQVMLNLFDGDPQPLFAITACDTADQFVRSGMFELIASLAARGDIPRAEAARFLRDSHATLPQREDYVWVGWHFAIARLGLDELAPLVEDAFDRGFVDPAVTNLRHFHEDLRLAKENPDNPKIRLDLEIEPFGDTIEELSSWHGFAEPDEVADLEEADLEEDDELLPAEPVTNPYRHVGRNDPCPCGSGKKFKRCCLGKAAPGGDDGKRPGP